MEFMIGLVVLGAIVLSSMVKILNDWERGVVLRLGKAVDVRGPGLILLIPFIERIIKVDTRTVTMDIPPQDVITKDNISMQVNAVLYFKVVAPMDAITK
jgi:regulator of protease activity HflC (stomatin/prohibitin superfamily)